MGTSSQYVDTKGIWRRAPSKLARLGWHFWNGARSKKTQRSSVYLQKNSQPAQKASPTLKAAQWYAVDDQRRLHDLATTIFETNPDPKLNRHVSDNAAIAPACPNPQMRWGVTGEMVTAKTQQGCLAVLKVHILRELWNLKRPSRRPTRLRSAPSQMQNSMPNEAHEPTKRRAYR